jgi:hypothetical protein
MRNMLQGCVNCTSLQGSVHPYYYMPMLYSCRRLAVVFTMQTVKLNCYCLLLLLMLIFLSQLPGGTGLMAWILQHKW